MVDPDSRAESVQCPRQTSVDFIKRVLIPEMVHDRRFCEPGSREFVEFDRADVEPFDARDDGRASTCELYQVTAHVKFSGEMCSFPLVVKLPRESADSPAPPFGTFQNEEMFYSKMTYVYGTDGVPKCYLSDLGRYGRPAIVLEDLSARGYVTVDRKLDGDHLKLCVKALAVFHGRGLRLRADKFAVFREFYAKLSTTSPDDDSIARYRQIAARALDIAKSLFEPQLVEKIKEKLGESPLDVMESLAEINDVSTVCHGRFLRDNVLFGYENGKPCDIKVIDWQTMRYCSPAMDLGFILFSNLPDDDGDNDDRPPKVGLFCRDTLRLYLDTVKHECPEVTRELLERDIVTKMLHAYLVLCTDENVTNSELATALRVLDDLSTFV